MNTRQTSQSTKELNCRIQTNQAFGDHDLTEWLLEKLHLSQGNHLLDVGCGTGKLLVPFAKITKIPNTCMGIDVSADNIDKARRAAENEGLRIDLVIGDMDQIAPDLYRGKFDIITAIYSAYYSKNIKALLKKLSHMLKKTGRIIIMGPYMDNNQEWFEFLQLFMQLPSSTLYQSSSFMCEDVLPFAATSYDAVHAYKFINHISIPSLEHLLAYWRSNTYYDEKYDSAFLKHATEFFSNNDIFRFAKTALLVAMQNEQI